VLTSIGLIKNDAEYQDTLRRVDALFEAKPGTAEGDELDVLMLLVEDYDRRTAHFPPMSPVEAVRVRMDELDLKQKDLVPALGHESTVSAFLRGKRQLTVPMVRQLADLLRIPPEVLI
jgi:HTH-type transcriptional regulator/antitoxin HigA